MSQTSYTDALERLQGLSRFGMQLGLERITRVLQRLGDPQSRFASIHLAGTNGKGSTAAMLASVLQQAGCRTGLYTSPHLCRFGERIQVGGRQIEDAELIRLAGRVLDLEPDLTFFEAATAIGLTHFAEQGIELGVVETGLGGRLDATNVIVPRVTVLTHIDLDHQEVLGVDLASIAREKAGVIKRGVPVVSAAPAAEVETVLQRRCEELGAPLFIAGRDFDLRGSERGCTFEWSTSAHRAAPGWTELQLALGGDHQQENAALCLAALSLLGEGAARFPADAVRAGLAATRWPGRMEWIGDVLLDGAHNRSGALVLARHLAQLGKRFQIILGLLGPKDPRVLIEPILPHADRLIFTPPRSPRALPPAELCRALPAEAMERIAPEVAPDLATALRRCDPANGPVLITGSLYLVGEARSILLGVPADPVRTADPVGRVSS